jgi:hypothetical protein
MSVQNPSVEMPNSGMNEGNGKLVTNRGDASPNGRSKKAGRFLKVKLGP